MLILSNTLKTFNRKVNKIKSLAKKKYYLQETLKKTNEEIDLILCSLNNSKNQYRDMLKKYPTAKDPETLNRIKFIMRTVLPELKLFKARVLALITELELAKNEIY